MGKTKEDTQQDQKPLIATRDTMTEYEMTVGQIIDGAREDIDRILGEKAEFKAKAESLDAELARVKKELASANMRLVTAGMKRTADGGVSLRIVVPVDMATPLLSQADEAQEDPEVYVQKAVEASLQAYAMSAG